MDVKVLALEAAYNSMMKIYYAQYYCEGVKCFIAFEICLNYGQPVISPIFQFTLRR